MVEYWLGVDGGGTGTRALLARADGTVLVRGQAGPSALGQGIAPAWQQIQLAVAQCFAEAGIAQPSWEKCAMAAGLSGVHNTEQRDALLAILPKMGQVILETDGYTMLVGAHKGQPGSIVAAGTGSVGEVLRADGSHAVVGGWGFPVGDEGSGSWLGMHAVRAAHAALDGRAAAGALAKAVWQQCGQTRQAMANWVAEAGQFAYAQVAPRVFECEATDTLAADLLNQAARDLEAIADALDPAQTLPVAVCGSIGNMLKTKMTAGLQARCVEAAMGPAEGALWLLQNSQGARP